MQDKLQSINVRYNEVQSLLQENNVMADMARYKSLCKELKDLSLIVEA